MLNFVAFGKKKLALFGLGILVASRVTAAVVDLAPGDLYAPRTSFNVASLTASESKNNGFFSNGISNGTKQLKVREVNASFTTFSAREGSSVPFFGTLGLSHLLIKDLENTTEASGVGDIRLGAGIWPHFDSGTGESFGIGISSTIPTGDYRNNRALNVGENRNRYNVLARYVSPQKNGLWFDVSVQKNWLTDNKNYLGNKLKTDPGHAVMIFTARRLNHHQIIYLGYEVNRGGRSYINSVEVNPGQKDSKVHVGFRRPITNQTEISIRSSKSLETETGYDQRIRLSLGINYRF